MGFWDGIKNTIAGAQQKVGAKIETAKAEHREEQQFRDSVNQEAKLARREAYKEAAIHGSRLAARNEGYQRAGVTPTGKPIQRESFSGFAQKYNQNLSASMGFGQPSRISGRSVKAPRSQGMFDGPSMNFNSGSSKGSMFSGSGFRLSGMERGISRPSRKYPPKTYTIKINVKK